MFDISERMVYTGVKMQDISNEISEYWTSQGFSVSFKAKNYVGGEAYAEEMGVKTQFAVNLYPDGDKTYVDLKLIGNVSSNSLILLVICLVFIWPVALLLGFLAYDKFSKRAKYVSYYMWDHLNRATGKVGVPAYAYAYAPMGPAPPPPPVQP